MPFVTDRMIYDTLQTGVMQAAQTLQTRIQHAQSGMRVMAPGDDPVAAAQAQVLGSGLEHLTAMGAAADTAGQQLAQTDSVLQGASTLLAQARELAVQGASGQYGARERTDMAYTAQSLHDALLQMANQQMNDQYLFGGFQTATPPFDATGAYHGDAGVRQVEVAPGVQVAMNLPGSQVFNQPGGQNVIGVLQELHDALASNDVAGIQTSIGKLDAASEQLGQAQASLGGQEKIVSDASHGREQMKTLLASGLADATQLDLAQGYSDMLQAQSAYQAAVAEATRILSELNRGLT